MSRLPWIAFACGLAAVVLVGTLAVLLWPPGPVAGALLAIAGALLAGAVVAQAADLLRRQRPWHRGGELPDEDAIGALIEERIRSLEDHERRLELRELRLARHMRVQLQSPEGEAIDLVDAEPSDEELARLVETDRKLMALIEAESQRAFDRVLENRYASGDGVNGALILSDLRAFVVEVSRLYRPDTEDPLLETDVELLAKSIGSTALHLLVVVDGLPLDLRSYSLASIYRLIRRGASYYGTYKAVRPYLEHGVNVFQAARLALGMNPATVGAAWVAGKLATHGAKALGERVLQQQALRLLHDFIRVVGFEAAMLYGGGFRHRDANWVFGAALVNLEAARGEDAAGRTAAVATLCRLALRHEFDRLRLLRLLADGKPVPVEKTRPQVVMTRKEREAAAHRLAKHCRSTAADLTAPAPAAWRETVEAALDVPLDLPRGARPPSRLARLRNRFGRSRDDSRSRDERGDDDDRPGELG